MKWRISEGISEGTTCVDIKWFIQSCKNWITEKLINKQVLLYMVVSRDGFVEFIIHWIHHSLNSSFIEFIIRWIHHLLNSSFIEFIIRWIHHWHQLLASVISNCSFLFIYSFDKILNEFIFSYLDFPSVVEFQWIHFQLFSYFQQSLNSSMNSFSAIYFLQFFGTFW